ncbi:MAG: MFS transporter, partial [Gemmatimonadetes bacterium]|nr:MFS transporter [Gemmatimonadota bacterium]
LSEPDLLGFLSVLLGLVLGMTQPLVMALVHNHTPTGRAGAAVGLRGVIINSSQTFMPILFGAVGSIMGMTPVFVVVAAVLMGFGWSERRTNAREHRKI